ncbi:hypothetical protein BC829DRAFT_488406 [Chytridium lagenaria]|nr:hypothetical protein BC829DRAFT_488406 [Chytridium lagenaria]
MDLTSTTSSSSPIVPIIIPSSTVTTPPSSATGSTTATITTTTTTASAFPPLPPASDVNHPSFWSGFHKKALKERQNQLRLFFPDLYSSPSAATTTTTTASSSSSSTPELKSPPPDAANHVTFHRSPSTSPTRAAHRVNGNDFIPSNNPASSRSTDSLVSLASTSLPSPVPQPLSVHRALGGLKRVHGSTASLAALDVGGAVDEPFPIRGLDEQIANNMIENCVGTLGVPLVSHSTL